MKKVSKFYKSHRQFAVDMGSLKVTPKYSEWQQPDGSTKVSETPNYYGTMEVIYFKKKDGVLSVTEGVLWGYFGDKEPKTALEFLERVSTRAYGPDVIAKWDGKNMWGLSDVDDIVRYRDILGPILKNYPNIPESYDGWWEF